MSLLRTSLVLCVLGMAGCTSAPADDVDGSDMPYSLTILTRYDPAMAREGSAKDQATIVEGGTPMISGLGIFRFALVDGTWAFDEPCGYSVERPAESQRCEDMPERADYVIPPGNSDPPVHYRFDLNGKMILRSPVPFEVQIDGGSKYAPALRERMNDANRCSNAQAYTHNRVQGGWLATGDVAVEKYNNFENKAVVSGHGGLYLRWGSACLDGAQNNSTALSMDGASHSAVALESDLTQVLALDKVVVTGHGTVHVP